MAGLDPPIWFRNEHSGLHPMVGSSPTMTALGDGRMLHVAPGMSAAGSLRQAVRDAGRDDDVIGCQDDLSFGPVASDAPAARAQWWSQFYDDNGEHENQLTAFWSRVTEGESPIVLWLGRRYAMEYAFALAFADRVGARPYSVIDVTDHEYTRTRRDGSSVSVRAQAASLLTPPVLVSLLGTERPVPTGEVTAMRDRWHQLMRENAPFRMVSGSDLVSAAIDHFDPLLLRLATSEWQREARIVGAAMGEDEAYLQASDMALMSRVVALVEQGKLLADGDPWHMRDCRIRLP